ncbi:uncharacterized protein LOC131647763 [Vicia villosa]|uniref:uncharacterized protein LOC131647763 n=1 Tax=Vicia villosa TaxID=3911 RepID=UPI00273C0A19|nr:uncharacterized protein LOC131647763 [Vicia villosa]
MEDYQVTMFQDLVMEGKWDDVIEKYQEDSNYHNILLERRGTALHVAINSWRNDVLKSLVEAILEFGDQSSLKIVNDRGATPLHLAAQIGYTNACEIIIGKEGQRKPLVQVKDENGETPLFWAVRARHISVFVYLRQFYPLDLNIAIDKHNTSILHVAISKEMFEMWREKD